MSRELSIIVAKRDALQGQVSTLNALIKELGGEDGAVASAAPRRRGRPPASATSSETPKRRGRPPGSKNKSATTTTTTTKKPSKKTATDDAPTGKRGRKPRVSLEDAKAKCVAALSKAKKGKGLSYQEIVNKTGLDYATVRRAMMALEEEGLVDNLTPDVKRNTRYGIAEADEDSDDDDDEEEDEDSDDEEEDEEDEDEEDEDDDDEDDDEDEDDDDEDDDEDEDEDEDED